MLCVHLHVIGRSICVSSGHLDISFRNSEAICHCQVLSKKWSRHDAQSNSLEWACTKMTGNEKRTPKNSVNSFRECVVCISQIKGCLNSLACHCTIMKFQMKHSVKPFWLILIYVFVLQILLTTFFSFVCLCPGCLYIVYSSISWNTCCKLLLFCTCRLDRSILSQRA